MKDLHQIFVQISKEITIKKISTKLLITTKDNQRPQMTINNYK